MQHQLPSTTTVSWRCTEAPSVCGSALEMAYHQILLGFQNPNSRHLFAQIRNLRHLLHLVHNLRHHQHLQYHSGLHIFVKLLSFKHRISQLRNSDFFDSRRHEVYTVVPSLSYGGNTASTFLIEHIADQAHSRRLL